MPIVSREMFICIETHSLAHIDNSRTREYNRVIRASKSNEGRAGILSVDKKQLARVIPYISLFW